MLASITPLGERGRGRRWRVTAALYIVSSSVGGATIGALLGLLGTSLVAVPAQARLAALAVLVALGIAVDLGAFGIALPSPRRQVDEEWLTRYRGWVVGVGFGAQLGAGIVTVVTSSTTYACLAAAILSGRPLAGAAIGGTFGIVRGTALLLVAGVRTPERLGLVDRALRRFDAPTNRATLAAQAALAIGAGAFAVAAR
jgi:hypothetical protein